MSSLWLLSKTSSDADSTIVLSQRGYCHKLLLGQKDHMGKYNKLTMPGINPGSSLASRLLKTLPVVDSISHIALSQPINSWSRLAYTLNFSQ